MRPFFEEIFIPTLRPRVRHPDWARAARAVFPGKPAMPDRFFYFLKTFLGTGPALFGIRSAFEHPAYTVRETLGSDLEIRDYPATSAVQAVVADTLRTRAPETAFRLLFADIAGKNRGARARAWQAQGAPYLLAYDPPFAIPFLKRNEIAIEVTASSR